MFMMVMMLYSFNDVIPIDSQQNQIFCLDEQLIASEAQK